MLSLFRLRRGRGPVDLALGMLGTRLGERLLQVGQGDPQTFAAAAGKVGLTGRACAVVETSAEAAALERAAVEEGVLVEVSRADPSAWPYEAGSFDVALVDGDALLAGQADRQGAWLTAVQRVVRGGGRILVVCRRPRGLAARLGFDAAAGADAKATAAIDALSRAGLGPARFLAAREGMVFVEAFRPNSPPSSVV